MTTPITTAPATRRKFAPLIVLAGLAATLVLALSTSGVLAGFTASISGTSNSVAAGTLLMKENQGATTCLSSSGTITTANAGTCATINKYSGSTTAVPGTPLTSTVTITNTGSTPANTFTLTASSCTATATASPAGSGTSTFCGKVDITINNDTTGKCSYPASTTAACTTPTNTNTLTTLASAGAVTLPTPVAPGASTTFTFTVMIDNTATNDHQGLSAAQTLQWSFAS